MRSFTLIIISLFLHFLSIGGVETQAAFQIQFQEISNNDEWQAVLEEAKASDKLIFVDAYTDWCGWCKELDNKVYTNADLAEFFNSTFINIKYDAEGEFGSILASQMRVTAFPTLLYLTPNGDTFERIEGFIPVETLQAYANDVITNYELWPQLLAKAEAGELTREEKLTLITLKEKMAPLEAGELATEYIASLVAKDYQEIENLWLVSKYENSLEGKPFQFVSKNKGRIIEWHGDSEYFDFMSAVYNDNLNLAIKYGDEDLMKRLIQEVLPELVEKDMRPRAIFSTRSIYYAQRQEFEKYHIEVNTFMNNHLSNEAKIPFVLSTSYEVLENYDMGPNLSFLDQLLNQGLAIDEKSFEVTSLLGYVKALQENFTKATELLNTASELASDDEEREMVASLREALDYLRGGN